jgi:hypothetical protein
LDILIIRGFVRLFKDFETSELMAPVPSLPACSASLLPYSVFQEEKECHQMKEDKFEPAKIISKPEPEETKGSDAAAHTQATDPEHAPVEEGRDVALDDPNQSSGESFEGILDRFTGKNKSTVVWASPYDMYRNGVFSGRYKSTVDQVAREIKGIIIVTIFHAYLLIGYYLLAVFFDNDESQAFSKNPYKETSINDLAKRDDIPFTRQRLTDCIKAAAVDMELRKRGHDFDHLNFEHQLQIARLKKQEQRLEVAQMVNEDRLTPNEVKTFINNMLGKTPSQDKQIGRALIRQLREFVRLTSDEDVQAFLADKDRSAALDHTEIAQLLDFSEKFRATATDSEEMLKQLETNLRQNFLEKQQQKELEPGKVSQELEA